VNVCVEVALRLLCLSEC